MKLRDEYKKKRKEAKNDEEYRRWDSAQMATKRGVNALYGVLAKDGYGWGDMEMAQAITASAREAMRSVAFKAIELGYDVIYFKSTNLKRLSFPKLQSMKIHKMDIESNPELTEISVSILSEIECNYSLQIINNAKLETLNFPSLVRLETSQNNTNISIDSNNISIDIFPF